MKRLLLVLALPAVSCTNQFGYPEESSYMYDKPATETQSARAG